MMKNKVLSIILCLATFMSMTFAVHAEEETAAPVSFETQVMRGLFVVDADFETNPDDELTRGDFVRILMDMIEAPGAKTLTVDGFKDITGGSSYSDAVMFAANMGYISGYNDGKFHPERKITPAEAVTVILKVAGYDIAAVQSGGYSEGYLTLARSQNMLDGVSGNVYQPMTKKDAATLLYNTLEVEVYSLTSATTNGGISIGRNGETFMESFMSLSRVRDIVTSTYVTSLTGEATCIKGDIAIAEVNYTNAYEKAEEYLGYRVEAYIKDVDKEEKLVFAIPYKTEVIEIKGEDIDPSSTATNIFYEIEGNDRLQKLKVEPDADKILNGLSEPYFTLEELLPWCDNIMLIDNDNDGVYEVVIIYSYNEMYVSSVSGEDEIIYGKYTFPGAINEVRLEDVDEVIITKGDAEIQLTDIKADNLITIISTSTENRDIIRINVSDKKISGVVTGIDFEENIVYIDNEEYKLSDLYLNALFMNDMYAKKIEVGMSGTFYLNPFGRISVVKVDTTTKRYGFVKKAYIDDSALDYCVRLRVLGTDGDWQVIELEDKVKFNGYKMNAETLLDHPNFSSLGKAIPQMIEFETNSDSKIKLINTAEESTGYYQDEFIVTPISGLPYRNANRSFNSRYYISGDTVTFAIPALTSGGRYNDDELAEIDDKYFIVYNGAAYADWGVYDLKLYNADKFGYTPLIVRETLKEDVGELSASEFLFNRITHSVNSDNEEQAVIEGLHGTNISASATLAHDVSVYDFTYSKDASGKEVTDINQRLRDISYLTRGDLLKLYLDIDNYVYRIDILYRYSKNSVSMNTGTLHEEEVYVCGYVTDTDHDRGFFLVNDGVVSADGTVIEKRIRLAKSDVSVYKIDFSKKTDNITVGNINDIQKGDYILLKGRQSNFGFVVIYE